MRQRPVGQVMPAGAGWREGGLVLLMLAPLIYLFVLHGGPIPQDQTFHVFVDERPFLGLKNFANVASNLPFLLVGAAGVLWCYRHPGTGATRSWMVFFLGVVLVFLGSGYYHLAPDDDTLVWDRLPMTVAFVALFVALVSEHVDSRLERVLLVPSILTGIASVCWWRLSDDLRVYLWVQLAPLLAIPFILAAFPGRSTHRYYLLYGLAFYALAKMAEFQDQRLYSLTWNAVSGHSLKHLLAAMAPCFVYLMLRRRQPVDPIERSQIA